MTQTTDTVTCEADDCTKEAVRTRYTRRGRRVRLCTFHDVELTASTFHKAAR